MKELESVQIADMVRRSNEDADELRRRVYELERLLAAKTQEHEHLRQVYNKLADQWNAFQATARPEQRYMYRAEGAGEATRKLTECLLGLAYGTGGLRDLITVLQELDDKQNQTLEVSEKLVPRRG